MKLIKTEKQFTNPFIEGALDIYADIENGNEFGENNAWIILKRTCEYLGLNYKTIAQAVNNNAIMKEQKVSEISDTLGGAQKTDFITWDCFGYIIANYLAKNANAKAIFDTWKHYSWVADIEKEIVGQAETFLKLAEECKERGDKRGFYSFMERYESEREWGAKLKAEKERAEKAENTIEEMKQRDIKTIANELQFYFKPFPIHQRMFRIMREKKVWNGKTVNKDFSPFFSAYKPDENGFFYSLMYNKGMGESVAKLIRDWLEADIEKEINNKQKLF